MNEQMNEQRIIKDQSGNGNDGVLNGGVTWAPESLGFDGTGYVDCGLLPDKPFIVEA